MKLILAHAMLREIAATAQLFRGRLPPIRRHYEYGQERKSDYWRPKVLLGSSGLRAAIILRIS
jgi:hypothetical protein